MTYLKGAARAVAFDDMIQLAFDDFVSAMPAEAMAKELSVKFGHLLDKETFAAAIIIAGHRYVREFGHQPPQTEDPDEPRQAPAAPELKIVNADAPWPPAAIAMR